MYKVSADVLIKTVKAIDKLGSVAVDVKGSDIVKINYLKLKNAFIELDRVRSLIEKNYDLKGFK